MRNVAFKQLGNILLAVYNDKDPTPEDHQKCVELFKKLDPGAMKALIITAGGAPTPAQRKEFTQILQGREYWMAVVTDSIVVRGVATAVSWFTKKTRAFSRDNLDDAFNYLQITGELAERMEREINAMKRDLKMI